MINNIINQKEYLIILQLLDHFNEIQGKTRLIKYLFLLEKEGNIGLSYGFISKYYGPYSVKADDAISTLKKLGFINEILEQDGKTIKYSLTSKGYLKKEEFDTKPELIQTFKKVLDKFKDLTLKELIEIVYANYPDYTILSKLK